jgi:hypothetical protein
MKLKAQKLKNGQYKMAVLRGHGGISSLIAERTGTFFSLLSEFLILRIFGGR